MELKPLERLKFVCNSLDANNIQYMISGSIALIQYIAPRFTYDIDIVINLFEKDIDAFCNIFNQEYYIEKATIIDEVKRRGMFNIIVPEEDLKFDFIIRKNSEYHIAEFNRKIRTSFLGIDLWVVSQEDLVIAKLLWIQVLESSLQKDDITKLLQKKDIDLEYIHTWCRKLQLKTYGLL